ncbi:unnamed protein product [Caenorhabditis auriculariae]|uniref:Uncharacterized protein n=1 Tax=Caenorhabditis auriculariae TaxID=2777116 RepID=A0A8S1GVL3_9PELO|nr:unnamed protein product [Caenorhabditis auriculariae]
MAKLEGWTKKVSEEEEHDITSKLVLGQVEMHLGCFAPRYKVSGWTNVGGRNWALFDSQAAPFEATDVA